MRIRLAFLILVFVLKVDLLKAQLTSEFTALHNLEKHKWERARGQLLKVLKKDSLNAGAHYGLSIYYFSAGNPNFQIDSAYQYALKALDDYQISTQKQWDRWRRLPMDSIILIGHREKIDSAAFERAVRINTEAGYIDFITQFSTASQKVLAIELRDEVAFLDALRENTYQSFLEYLTKYPEAVRAVDAKFRYEKLLFEAKTKDKKLSSYESFLLEYPATPYRRNVEKQIFEIVTASGMADDFVNFLSRYPTSHKAQMARNILYHILKAEEKPFQFLMDDSIRKVRSLEKSYLVPFLKEGKFGFMNAQGEEVLKAEMEEIDDLYRCGNIIEELLVLGNKIITRNGSVLYTSEVEEVEDLDYGFLKIGTKDCVKVIHYSGYGIGVDECFEDASLLGNNYVALKKNKKWSVWTLTGRMLLSYEWDNIQSIGDLLVFDKNGKYKLADVKSVATVANQKPIQFLAGEFDEVKAWPESKVWVRMNDKQAVLTQELAEWIPLAKHEITSTFFGAISHDTIDYKLYGKYTELPQAFNRIKVSNPWVAGATGAYWQLIKPTINSRGPLVDSIDFIGPFAITFRSDSMRVYMPTNTFVEFPHSTTPHFLPGKDSIFFLLMEEQGKKKVYSHRGELLFTTTVDFIEYNNEGYFTIHKKGKRGLLSLEGKLVVQPEFDAMGTVSGSMVTVLKDRKFGLLNLTTHKQIKTEYEKNIVTYNESCLIVFKNGFYAFMHWDNKPLTPFEFEEIRYWNDSSALVKKNFNWIIYNFLEKKVVMDKIKNFKWVLDTDQEKIMIFQQENTYGVLSNRRGIVIAPTFSDIINLGSASVPLYFTEKHVEEAGIYVVIYYDKEGQFLRRQVYEVEDYERIYCIRN